MKRMTLALVLALVIVASAFAADHIEAPLPIAHPATDICDFYAWTKSGRPIAGCLRAARAKAAAGCRRR